MLSIVFCHSFFTSIIYVSVCFDMLFLEPRIYWKQPLKVGRCKVCVHSSLSRSHLWDYIEKVNLFKCDFMAFHPSTWINLLDCYAGGYAETLIVQQNRKAEGEKMKQWAETAWTNRRLSLAEALESSESSAKVSVIDTRIRRVL